MKKGYRRLLIFELLITFSLLLLNNFASSILGEYTNVVFFIVIGILFYFLFGFEKDRHRYSKTICIEMIINLLVFYILYYLLGILIGFVKNGYTINFMFLIKTIIPVFIGIVLQEFLRYMFITKSEGSKLLITTTIIMFILISVKGNINRDVFSSTRDAFIFIATILLPAISRNVFTSYLSYKSGYVPPILYLAFITLLPYIAPIRPNPNEYIYSLIELLVPMIFMYKIYSFYKKDRDEDVVREKQHSTIKSLIIPTLISLFLVYIVSGYFKYHAIVVASGSMMPKILKGDVVVIEKTNNYKDIKVGDVLAFSHGKIIVVHRVIKKINIDGKYYFYTKGDNNDSEDNYTIEEKDVRGLVNIRIPFIGYPTLWLNNL